MSEEITEGGLDVDTSPPAPNGFASIRDRIRAEREAMASDKTLDLLVPGYSGLVGVRYRALSEREFSECLPKQQGGIKAEISFEDTFRANYSLLITACETIIWREEESDEFQPALDENGDPIRFDVRLAEYLGFEAETARETVAGFFAPEGTRPLAVAAHANAVTAWLNGNTADIDAVLLGN